MFILRNKNVTKRGRKLMVHKNTDNLDHANSIDPIELADNSRSKDEKTRNIIANMDAIDFQTLLAEQMNR